MAANLKEKKPKQNLEKVAIIGGGPAGLTAAVSLQDWVSSCDI